MIDIKTLLEILNSEYPVALCGLDYAEPWQLLIATRLSAQCTDKRVNLVTAELFELFPTLYMLAEAELETVERIVHPCGLYRVKARDCIGIAAKLISDFDCKVPDEMELLLTLPGVGRKTANVILGDVFGKPAIVTDTHCIRLSRRLGLTDKTEPKAVEQDLLKLIPPAESAEFCHRLILHGRKICSARSPKCGICPLGNICMKFF
ncbi:MAG: endonuclease III [Oscillospiraceae bacterium]|jgi:endonuclease-3|nr:endonuclease III [Oscillospiraceae bacterium]